MDLDFALILTLAVLITGVVWLIDILFFARKRKARTELARQQGLTDAQALQKLSADPWPVEYAKSFFPVLAVVFVLRSFVVEPYQIPSGSMLPTLEVGDFILVNKFAYGLRMPVINTKLLDLGEPQRGDVMVFKFPGNLQVNYIKRVVGLPGDHVAYFNKRLYVNGQEVPEQFLANIPPVQPSQQLFQEQLGDVSHRVYKAPTRPQVEAEWEVPAGHYFMMGDNRDNSNDSRYWGFVPERYIVGKAFYVWLHWEKFFSMPNLANNGRIH